MDVATVAFVGQMALAAGTFALGRWLGGRAGLVAAALLVASLIAMLVWPLMRLVTPRAIDLTGVATVACTEFTLLAIPAGLFFGVASRRVKRGPDRRAIAVLTLVAGVYFVKAGWWMVGPGVRTPGPTAIDSEGICRQTTDATCVAASMVTALRMRGIEAEEEEMARLAYTERSGGTTDSRALWALQRKLAGTGLRARYERMDLAALRAATKPVLVQLHWGFFASHMVPVLEVTDEGVVIGDPMGGVYTMTLAAFEREWKGMGIVIER
jgi:predicted double-glycine peptidase